MADTGIFATTAEVQRHVNVNSSSTANVEAYINQFMTEAMINSIMLFNFSDAYTSLNVDVKGILKSAACHLAAMDVEAYDPDAIGRSTMTLSSNLHLQKYNFAIAELKKINTRKYMVAA
jgi:hypothetical protein